MAEGAIRPSRFCLTGLQQSLPASSQAIIPDAGLWRNTTEHLGLPMADDLISVS
jgi:hypothetical protein